MTKSKDWQFIDYEHSGQTFKGMYEHSGGSVSACLFLKDTGQWSPPLATHHLGPEPIRTARMLFRDIANAQQRNSN